MDELTTFRRGQVASPKTPVFWAFRDELLMTQTGKIQKLVLREEIVKGLLTFDEVRESAAPGSPASSGPASGFGGDH